MAFSASATSNAPGVKITLPPASLLRFPPSSQPETLTPPFTDFTLARPFNIDPALYNELLRVQYPITVAIVYTTVIFFLNRLNKQRHNKPWGISKTRVFFAFVIMHNMSLAVYSGWTFVGMVNAVKNVWPGWDEENGLVEVVDAFCKISGPRGLGSAACYKPETESWDVSNRAIKLLDGKPDSTDVGRLWNEGLAFYGWLFYLSKFYEIVDSLIIIAKGKRSSFLQTYHHAGAMFCLWAGIRYMSPPIWMFVTINSGIHALMYTYYTLAALSFRIPTIFKRTLTTLQIAQFVFGASYALGHFFVAYRIPVETPYLFIHNLSTELPSVTSTLAATATAVAEMSDWMRKMAFRAMGDEALAEAAHNYKGETFGLDATKAADIERANAETRYRLGSTMVNCIDTSGEAFAIYLNVMYLAPLTYLFVRFFIRSYLQRSGDSTSGKPRKKNVSESSADAARGVETEILKAMARDRGSELSSAANSDAEPTVAIPAALKKKIDGAMEGIDKTSVTISEKASEAGATIKQTTSGVTTSTSQMVTKAAEQTTQTVKEVAENGTAKATAAKEAVQDAAADPSGTAITAADVVKHSASEARELVERAYAAASRGSGNDADEGDVRDEGFFDGASDDGKGEKDAAEGAEGGKEGEDENVKKEEGTEPDSQGDRSVEDSGVLVGREDEKHDAQGDGGNKRGAGKKEDGKGEAGKDDGGEKDGAKKEGEVKPEQAYEASVDELTTSDQRAAEKAMQPPTEQSST